MLAFIVRRLLAAVPVILFASFLVFSMVHLLPGDPVAAIAGDDSLLSPEAEARLRDRLGLDQPFPVRYARWVGNAARGDLGMSFRTHQPVTTEIRRALPATLQLMILSTILSIAVGIPAGIISAVKSDTWADVGTRVVALGGIAIPNFWLGILLILTFAYWIRVLPTSGYVSVLDDPWQGIKYTILPSIALGTSFAAVLFRQMRGALLDVLREDYVRTAWAKGLSPRVVILRHAVRNAFLPVLTVLGMHTGALIGGAVVTEQVFAYPGLGRVAVHAITYRSVEVLQAVILLTTIAVVVANLVTDILYGVLNPRIRVAS